MTYSFSATPFKFLVVLIFRNRKSILKFIWNLKGLQIAKIILRKNNITEGLMLPDIKIYNKVIVIKTVWCWHKNRCREQWNRIESPEINYNVYGLIIVNKGAKIVQWEKASLFNKCCRENFTWISTCEVELLPHTIWKNNSLRIKHPAVDWIFVSFPPKFIC